MNSILWIHGFPLSSQIFDRQRAIEGVQHVMPDLPGFGKAVRPRGEPSMDDYARFAVAHLDDLGIEKATLAGLSMGGYICFSALRLFPERISGLILMDTRETADTTEGRQGRYDMIDRVLSDGVKSVADEMLPKMLTPAAPPSLKEWTHALMMSASADGIIAALRAIAHRADASDLLPSIRVPTLVVVGEEDPITPPADAQRMANAIPGARLARIAGAAHLSTVEQPDAVNAAVTSWASGSDR